MKRSDEAKMKALRGGYFVEHIHDMRFGALPEFNRKQESIKNTLVNYGATSFLQTVFQAATPLAASFYIGLTNSAYTFDGTTLAGIAAGEPVGNGYARIQLTRNNVSFTVQEVNGVIQALSKLCTFTCTGSNWTQNWLRMFICDAAAGTSGNVISLSGPAPAPRVVVPGAGPTVQYAYYLRG